jgi:hypothetical protein
MRGFVRGFVDRKQTELALCESSKLLRFEREFALTAIRNDLFSGPTLLRGQTPLRHRLQAMDKFRIPQRSACVRALANPGQTEMTLMQLCLTIKAKWLDATAQTTDRSVFGEIRGHDIPRNFPIGVLTEAAPRPKFEFFELKRGDELSCFPVRELGRGWNSEATEGLCHLVRPSPGTKGTRPGQTRPPTLIAITALRASQDLHEESPIIK